MGHERVARKPLSIALSASSPGPPPAQSIWASLKPLRPIRALASSNVLTPSSHHFMPFTRPMPARSNTEFSGTSLQHQPWNGHGRGELQRLPIAVSGSSAMSATESISARSASIEGILRRTSAVTSSTAKREERSMRPRLTYDESTCMMDADATR